MRHYVFGITVILIIFNNPSVDDRSILNTYTTVHNISRTCVALERPSPDEVPVSECRDSIFFYFANYLPTTLELSLARFGPNRRDRISLLVRDHIIIYRRNVYITIKNTKTAKITRTKLC